MKSDGEPSILNIVEVIQATRGTLDEEKQSLRRDSSSNGTAEQSIKDIERMCRTFKSSLEGRIGKPLDG